MSMVFQPYYFLTSLLHKHNLCPFIIIFKIVEGLGRIYQGSHTVCCSDRDPGKAFYKVPRATAVRILSAVRESILWILKLFSERLHQNELRESGSLCPYVRYAASHTEVSL